MGSQLEQVKMVCCQLDDKRVNIRKKAHDQLRDLLNNSQIVATIDRVSVTGSARDWTWQDVYRTAYGFLKKEADKKEEDEKVGRDKKEEDKKEEAKVPAAKVAPPQ